MPPPSDATGWGADPAWGQADPWQGWSESVQQRGIMYGAGPMCPRCGSTFTTKGAIPTWAIVLAIVGFFIVCVLSLLFLLVKDENACQNCGLRWK